MLKHICLALIVLIHVVGCASHYQSREYSFGEDAPAQPTAAQLDHCPDGHKALKDVPILAGLLWITPELQRKIDNLEVWPVGCTPLGNYKTQVVCTKCRFAYEPVF